MIRPRKHGKRGFKKDVEATKDRHFHHRRSFVSTDGHDILFGMEDKKSRRQDIYERAHGRCELNLAPACKGFVNWNSRGLEGWAHLDIEPHRLHCDCASNGAAACDPCHRWFHNHAKVARQILEARTNIPDAIKKITQETADGDTSKAE